MTVNAVSVHEHAQTTSLRIHNLCVAFLPQALQGAMERIWTGALQRDWIARRESYRKSRSRPVIEELRVSKDHKDQEALQAALRLERSKIKERLEAYYTKTVPWDVRFSLSCSSFCILIIPVYRLKSDLRLYTQPRSRGV